MTTPTRRQLEERRKQQKYHEYHGMSYEQASREAERLIKLNWFQHWDRLKALHQIVATGPMAQDLLGVARDDWLHPPTIERCAKVAEGKIYKEYYRKWSFSTGNRSNDSEITKHSDAIAAALRALKEKP